MKFTLNPRWLLGALAVGCGISTSFAAVVYNNSTNDVLKNFYTGTDKVGDQIILGGTDRLMTKFTFDYWATNNQAGVGGTFGTNGLAGTVSVTLALLKNDGSTNGIGYARPNGVIWQSTPFAVPATSRLTLIYDSADFGSSITLPNEFTWVVQFSGASLGINDFAGLSIFDPPVLGQNYKDYWRYNGSDWQLLTNSGVANVNFAATVEAVPEPSAVWFMAVSGLVGLGFAHRWTRKSKS
jgi:hypothetical protein